MASMYLASEQVISPYCPGDAIAWSPGMIFDCIVFGLTLYKRLKTGCTVQNSLFTLMLRDG